MTDSLAHTRRQFLSGAVAAAAAGSAAALALSTDATAAARRGAKADAARQDDNDRSPSRDPMAIHRSTLVINGLDPSNLSAEYLEMQRRVGISGWLRAAHQTLGEFAASHVFYDEHRDRIVMARTVREIRQAHAQGKIAQVL